MDIFTGYTEWLVFILFTCSAFGARLPIKVYSTTEGLAQSTVHRIIQDSRGFLWFGTSGGLSRFDGHEFRNYTTAHGLPDRTVRDVLELRDGSLWVATDGGGVCRFDPGGLDASAGQPMFECVQQGLSSEAMGVRVLAQDAAGTLWAGTNSGLYRLETIAPRRWAPARLPGAERARVWSLLHDTAGSLWVGTTTGLYRGTLHAFERFSTGEGFPSDSVQALALDPQGRMWAGTERGLCRLVARPLPGHPAVEQTFTTRDGLPADLIKAIHFSGQGTLWIGTPAGMAERARDSGSPVAQFQAYSTPQGLSSEDVNTLQHDRDGNLWIGTESGGAVKLSGSGLTQYGRNEGLGSAYVLALVETRAGQVCALTRAPGKLYFNFFDGEGFKAVPIPVSYSYFSPSWTGWYQIAAEQPDGHLWVASERGLLSFSVPSGSRQFGPPTAIYGAADGVPGTHVYQVFLDSHGGLWVATRGPASNGLARWNPQTRTFYRFSEADGLPSLTRARANGFLEDRHGQIWIGLHTAGVLRFAHGRFRVFTVHDGVPSGGIRRIYEDSQGRLWLGSGTGGVGRIDDPTADHLLCQTYSLEQGLSSSEIQAIVEDRWGRLYFGTGHGVDRLDLDASGPARVRHFTAHDGLAPGELQTALRDRHGVLWFGSAQGVSRLVPAVDPPSRPHAVYITGLKVNGRPLPVSHSAVQETELPLLHAGRDQLQVEFSAPSFVPGETLLYQYRLSSRSDWSAPTAQRSILFPDLPAGERVLQIRVADAGQPSTPSIASLRLQVVPPLWERWWFLLLSLSLMLLAIYWAHRYDLRRRLEVEAIRLRIARDLHDQVGTGLSQIAILSEVARHSTANASEAITQIADVSRELVDAVGDIVWVINPARDNLHDLTQRMRRFASDLLSAYNVHLEFRAEELEQAAAIGPEVRRQVYLIYRECLRNVIRHSRCSRVRVHMARDSAGIVLEIADDGVGFDPAAANSGTGLSSLRERARSLGGQIAWETRSGTTITLRVPLPV